MADHTYAHELRATVRMRNDHGQGVVVDRHTPEAGPPQYRVLFTDEGGRETDAWWEEDMLQAVA